MGKTWRFLWLGLFASAVLAAISASVLFPQQKHPIFFSAALGYGIAALLTISGLRLQARGGDEKQFGVFALFFLLKLFCLGLGAILFSQTPVGVDHVGYSLGFALSLVVFLGSAVIDLYLPRARYAH